MRGIDEETDLRPELMERLRDPETRRRIADALVTEAVGGVPDPKSGVPKGGATVIRAFELIREIALERSPVAAAGDGFSGYTDAELTAMLTSLDAAAPTSPEGAAAPGGWTSGVPPPAGGSRYG